MERLLWYVFAGSRGGPTRVRIMRAILDAPRNTRAISQELGMDYKTIQYNLRVLDKHVLVVTEGDGYGKLWKASKNLLANLSVFEAIEAAA